MPSLCRLRSTLPRTSSSSASAAARCLKRTIGSKTDRAHDAYNGPYWHVVWFLQRTIAILNSSEQHLQDFTGRWRCLPQTIAALSVAYNESHRDAD